MQSWHSLITFLISTIILFFFISRCFVMLTATASIYSFIFYLVCTISSLNLNYQVFHSIMIAVLSFPILLLILHLQASICFYLLYFLCISTISLYQNLRDNFVCYYCWVQLILDNLPNLVSLFYSTLVCLFLFSLMIFHYDGMVVLKLITELINYQIFDCFLYFCFCFYSHSIWAQVLYSTQIDNLSNLSYFCLYFYFQSCYQ